MAGAWPEQGEDVRWTLSHRTGAAQGWLHPHCLDLSEATAAGVTSSQTEAAAMEPGTPGVARVQRGHVCRAAPCQTGAGLGRTKSTAGMNPGGRHSAPGFSSGMLGVKKTKREQRDEKLPAA